MKVLIDIPDHLYKLLKDLQDLPNDSNEGTIENVLWKAVENGTPIDNATNRDVIDAMFKDDDRFYLNTDKNGFIHFRGVKKDWLDEPYQKGGK